MGTRDDVEAHMATPPPRKPLWRDPDLRDAVLFFVGLVLTVHEAFFVSTDRPDLLVLYAGMMGLPVVLYSKRNGGS